MLLVRRLVASVRNVNGNGQVLSTTVRFKSESDNSEAAKPKLKKAKTPVGSLDEKWEVKNEEMEPVTPSDPFAPFPNATNPVTGEIGGPRGPEPTRYGDWEKKGLVSDF